MRPASILSLLLFIFSGTQLSAQFPSLNASVINSRVEPSLKGRDIWLNVLTVDPRGNYLVAGTIYYDATEQTGDYWIGYADTTGKLLWEKTLKASGNDELAQVVITGDGGYLLAGTSDSPKGGDKIAEAYGKKDYWLVKLNSAGEVEWQQSLGGSDDDELMHAAIVDTGYSIGGWSHSEKSGNTTMEADSLEKIWNFGYHGFWIAELDKQGKLVGQKDMKEIYSSLTGFYFMLDGGYLLTGNKGSGNEFDWLIRLDALGNILWVKTYTDLPYQLPGGTLFTETPNGCFYFGDNFEHDTYRSNNSDYAVLCFTPAGELKWHRTYGGDNRDDLEYICAAGNDGLLLAGTSKSDKSGSKTENTPGDRFTDMWVLKVDDMGEITWQMTLGGYDNELMGQVAELHDGSCIIAGSSISDSSYHKKDNSYGKNDYWIVKRSKAGTIEWQRTLGTEADERLTHMQPTPDGGFLLAGTSKSGSEWQTVEDIWLVKLDASGNTVWQKNYDANYGSLEFLTQNGRGEIYVTLNMSVNNLVIRLAPDGETLNEMETGRELLLFCLPAHFYRRNQIVLGKNEIVIREITSYLELAFRNAPQVGQILDICFSNIKIMGSSR